jgi:hypothetical protein
MSYKSGTKFRSRKIDNKRPLAVYRSSELQDLNELTNLSRAAPMVATGVEKEEEEEYHLQNALHSTQSGVAHHTTFIPTPDASRLINNYKDFYNKPYHQPKSLIRHSIPMEEAIGCLYNMDEQDDIFFAEYTKELKEGKIKEEAKINEDQFEEVMYALENLTNQKFGDELLSLEELQEYMNTQLHPPPSECYHYIYEYWKKRRLQRNKKPIQPYLKTEELKIDSDPYVCFRRREIKTLRKTRRCDALSLEKLKRLQVEMEQAHELMEMVCKREKLRRDSLLLEHKIFEQKILIRQMKKKLGVVSSEKIQNELESNGSISSISENPANKISNANVNSSISVNVLGTQANVNDTISSGSGHTRVRKKIRKSNIHHNSDEPSSKRLTLPKIKIRQSSVIHNDYEGGRTAVEKVAQVEANTRNAKKTEEEKPGWIDLMDLPDPTEDLPYIHQGNTFYQSDLPMTINYKTFSLRSNQSLPFARRRIGRGGRVIFDRRVSLQKIREIKKLHKYSIGLLGQPGTYEGRFHNHGSKGKSRPKLPWLKNAYPQRRESVDYQWFDECSDLDDFESEEDIREDNNSLVYNSKIYTETDQMVLQVKPTFPEQFNPFITMKRPVISNNNNISKVTNTSSSHLQSSSIILQNTEVTTASTTVATLASSKFSISNSPNNNNISPASSLLNTKASSIIQLSSTQSPLSTKIPTLLTSATLTTTIPSRSSTPTIKGTNIVTTSVSNITTSAAITTIDTSSTKANDSTSLLKNSHLSPISKVNEINSISSNPAPSIPTSNMEISSSIHHSGSLSNKSHNSTPTMTAGSPLNNANSKVTNNAVNVLKSTTLSNEKFTTSMNVQTSPTSVSTKTMPNGLAANTLQVNALNNAAIASSLNKVTGPSATANNKSLNDLMSNSKTMASPKVAPTLKNSNINSMNVSPISTVGAMNTINVINKMKLSQGYASSPVNEANLTVEGLKNTTYLAQTQAQAKNQRISSPYNATAKTATLNPYMSNINANVLANAKLNNYYNNATASAIAAAKAGSFALTSSTVANTTSTTPTTTTINTTSTIGVTSKTTAATTLIQTPILKTSLQPTTVSTTTTPLMKPNAVNPLSGAHTNTTSEIMLGSSPISTPNSVKSTARKTIRKDTPTMNATTTLKSAQTTPTSKPTIDDPKTIALRHLMQVQAQAQKNAQLQQQLSQQSVLASEAAAVSHIHTGNVAATVNQNAVGILNNANVTAASALNGAHTTTHVNHGNSINISNLPANAAELNPAVAAIAAQSSPIISTANTHLPQNLQNVLLNSQQANLIHEGNMNVFAGAGLSPQKNLSNIALVNNLAAQRQQQQNKLLMTNAVNQGVVGLNQASLLQNQAIQNPLTQQQRLMQLRLQQLRNVVPNTMNTLTQQQAILYRQQQQQQQLLLNALQRQNINKMNAMPMMMANPNALPKGVTPSASPPRQFVQPAFLPQYQQAQHQRNLMLMQQQLKMMNNKQFAEQVNGGLGNNAALMMSNGLFNGLGGIPTSTANQILINQQRAALVNSKEELAKATTLNGIIDDKSGANVLLNEVAVSQAAGISKKI